MQSITCALSVRPAKSIGIFLAIFAVITLSGCDKDDDKSKNKNTSDTSSGAPAPAPQVTGVASSQCPAKVNDRLVGPDIVGLKLGLKRDEAVNVALCENSAFEITYDDSWLRLDTHAQKLAKQVFTATAGEKKKCRPTDMECVLGDPWKRIDERIIVATPGVAGGETAVAVWRTQKFADGKMPTVADAEAALVAKYGSVQIARDLGSNSSSQQIRELRWGKDPQGNVLSDKSSNFNRCIFAFSPDGSGDVGWAEGCGMTIGGWIKRAPLNPALAAEISVGLMDQQALFNYGQAVQAQLDQIDAASRKEQIDKAKSARGAIKF
jgi:hypothetical protein